MSSLRKLTASHMLNLSIFKKVHSRKVIIVLLAKMKSPLLLTTFQKGAACGNSVKNVIKSTITISEVQKQTEHQYHQLIPNWCNSPFNKAYLIFSKSESVNTERLSAAVPFSPSETAGDSGASTGVRRCTKL